MNKKITTTILLIATLALPCLAENITIGSRTATDYLVKSISYQHDFNDEYSGNVYYSYDDLDKQLNSFNLSIDKYSNDSSYFTLSYGGDYYVDNYRTNTFGFSYGKTFKDSPSGSAPKETKLIEQEITTNLVDTIATADTEEYVSADAVTTEKPEQWFIPRLNFGGSFSNTSYFSTKLRDNAKDLTFGGGAALGKNIDVSFSWDSYSYTNEQNLRDAGPRKIANNPLLAQLSTSPRSLQSGTLTIIPNDFWQLYYTSSLTIDLLNNIAGSRTTGMNFTLFEDWNLDISKETTSDNTDYSAISLGYYF
jgi:hypothetical protein